MPGGRRHAECPSCSSGTGPGRAPLFVFTGNPASGKWAVAFGTTRAKAQRRQFGRVRSRQLRRFECEERLPMAIARRRKAELGMAVIILDIVHFKQVNDRFGHAVGEELLEEFARRLRICARTTDTVARLGGGEFVMILEGLHGDNEAARVARAVLDTIRLPYTLGSTKLSATTSIGIAYCASGQQEVKPSSLLASADAALYRAKAAGRDGFQFGVAAPVLHAE